MAVGGVATPVWPSRRPDHLPPELDWIVGCTYQGQPTLRTDVRNLWGCNMSVRSEVFQRVGNFDEQVGRIGLIPLGTEETELCIRIAQQIPGARVVFEPRARVHHQVTEARATWAYLRSRSHAEGVSKAAMVAEATTQVLNRLILFVFPILLPLGKLTDGLFALDAIDHHDAREVIYLMLKDAGMKAVVQVKRCFIAISI